MSRSTLLSGLTFAMTLGFGFASAEALAGPGGGGHGPRGKMVEACKSKSAGAKCSVKGRDGKAKSGTCTDTPRGKLVCLTPEMAKRHEEARAKAKEACKSKSSGAQCSFSVGPRTIDGTCFDAPAGRLCRPNERAK